MKQKNVIYGSFKKTIGVFSAILAFALVLFVGVYVHDSSLVSKHEQKPQLSSSFIWGGLNVNIELDRRELSKSFNDIYCVNKAICKDSKSTRDIDEGKQLIVIGRIDVTNSTWNRDLEVPDNLLELKYKPEGGKVKFQYQTADLGSIPIGMHLSARKTISSDIRIQVVLKDTNDLGTLLINDTDVQLPVAGYQDIEILNM